MPAPPATNGRNVRTIGTNCASITALPPCLTKKSWASRTCFGLTKRAERAGRRLRRVAEEAVGDPRADRVVHGVAGDGRQDQRRHQDADVEHAGRGERAGGEVERVAGQERRHDESGLGEDDGEEHRVGPRAGGIDDGQQPLVHVEQEVDHPSSVQAGEWPARSTR